MAFPFFTTEKKKKVAEFGLKTQDTVGLPSILETKSQGTAVNLFIPKKKEEPMRFPVTQQGIEKIRELAPPPAPTMFTATLPEFLQHKINEVRLKEKELVRFKTLYPERYRELYTNAPLRFDSMVRDKLLEEGKITQEEARIFAGPEIIVPFIGMGGKIPKSNVVFKNLIKRAKTFKSGGSFSEYIAKDWKVSVSQLDDYFKKVGIPSAKDFWKMATKKTTDLVKITEPVKAFPSKAITLKPPIGKAPITPSAKLPIKPTTPKGLESLAQEAKSAEEFVDSMSELNEKAPIIKDRRGNRITDLSNTIPPINNDGTITLYHSTTKEGADSIIKNGFKGSLAEKGNVFFTTNQRGGQFIGEGKNIIIETKIKPERLLQDISDTTRNNITFSAKDSDILGVPTKIIVNPKPTTLKSQLTDFYNQAVKKPTADLAQEIKDTIIELKNIPKGEIIKNPFQTFYLGEIPSEIINKVKIPSKVDITRKAIKHIIEQRGEKASELIEEIPNIIVNPSKISKSVLSNRFVFSKMNGKAKGVVLEVIKKPDSNQVVTAYFIDNKSFRKLVDISGRPDVPPSFLKGMAESDISVLQKPTDLTIAKATEAVKTQEVGKVKAELPIKLKPTHLERLETIEEAKKVLDIQKSIEQESPFNEIITGKIKMRPTDLKEEWKELLGERYYRIFKKDLLLQTPDELATDFGMTENQLMEQIGKDIERWNKVLSELRTLRTQRKDISFEKVSKILKTKLSRKEIKLEKVKTAKEILDRRRYTIKAVQKQFGLSDADIKSITKRDIRLLNNLEFKQLIDDIRIKAEKLSEKKQAMNELVQQIKDKELDVENLRKAMKLPTLKNMTIADIKKLDEALKPFQKGDVFLSLRKLETVDRTELKGIRTWREARERLAEKLGVELSEISNIKVSEFDRYRWDTPLARQNPFYGMMVEETAKRMLISEAEYLALEKEIFKLAKGLKPGIFVPQYKNIRKFMEAPVGSKPELTANEIKLAEFMTSELEKAREYLIKIEAMNLGKDNYFTHIRRGILEAVKEDGIIQAVKEVFINYKQVQQNFEILDRMTGEVMALDKFFKYAMHRTGGLIPSENVVKSFLTYMKTFKKKQALDEIVPLIDIYAHSITPRETTKTGILLHGNLIKFVKEWLNTQKGRHITLTAKQGGKIDATLRSIKLFTSLRDLGLNIPVSVATEVGEQITTYQLLGKKNFLKGKIRQNTKQGKAIIEKYRNFIGKNPWTELVEPAREINDRLMEGIFILFRDASVRANKTFLLGSLSKGEFQSGVISNERLAKLRLELGRYRMITGVKSIVGATPEGRSWSQYKTWALPILNTTLNNIKNVGKVMSKIPANKKSGTKSLLELYRALEITAFVLMVRYLAGTDENDKSFAGQMINKAYREATTLIQALQPTMWLSAGRTVSFLEDLGEAILQIVLWEKYKTKEGLKGVEKLKRTLEPVMIKQFRGEKKSSGGGGIEIPGIEIPSIEIPSIEIPSIEI